MLVTLNETDVSKFAVFQDRNKPYIKRQRVILRWLVCLILLISVPVLRIDSKIYIIAIVVLTFLWIVLSGMFMDYIMIRQSKKKVRQKQRLPFIEMDIELTESGLQMKQDEKEYRYSFTDITHVFRFHKLFIITTVKKHTVLIPYRAFHTKDEYRYFYIQLMEGCNKKMTQDEVMKEDKNDK